MSLLKTLKIHVLMIVGEGEIIIKDLYCVLMANQLGNAKECKTLIKHKKVYVNHVVKEDPYYRVYDNDCIMVNHQIIKTNPFVYYMLNKPKGYVSASIDKIYPCVNELVKEDCFCIGRLDMNTTGLLLLTNDKTIYKKLLLPSFHVEKKYYVTVEKRLDSELIDKFKQGVIIDQDVKCGSAILDIIDDYHCYVTLYEGKYHQIKKMFLSSHNQVLDLKRISFAGIHLDDNLTIGQSRKLTDIEIENLYQYQNKEKEKNNE